MIVNECRWCGSKVESNPSVNKKFCNQQCHRNWQKSKPGVVSKTCFCGVEFSSHVSSKRKYCSLDCAYKGIKTVFQTKCKGCGCELTSSKEDRKYCSLSCMKLSLRKTISCGECGVEFTVNKARNRKFCSRDCSSKHTSKEYSDGRFIGDKNPNFGNSKVKEAWKSGAYKNRKQNKETRGIGGRYKGIWMRSSWEREYAEHLDSKEIKWEYEPKRFSLGEGTTYTPDFYLPEIETYVEVKGYWWPKAKEKFEKFLKQYKSVKIIIEDNNKEWKL